MSISFHCSSQTEHTVYFKISFFKDGKLILEGVLYFYFSIQERSDSCPKVSNGIPRAFLVYRQLWERRGHRLESTSLKGSC